MTKEGTNPCDVDDVVCQIEVLAHLRGLQKGLGNEQFLEKFPELAGLEERLTPKIVEQEEALKQSLEDCGESQFAPDEAEPPEKPDDEEEVGL